ncbi:DoxX family protein [Nocardioides flavescens]|uniref:DoxX family protein n=1 Tax=Nocardioides flavescens TaxID=2691959 RepID=A0A6L7EU39_9ACTN|nr:DoxX family protein [Nocardioides flavescens]MXG90210.1 DoxX family protein [Nocardioides flavescens]
MNVALWIVAGLLAVAFAAAGAMKLTQPREKLAESGLGWVHDFSPSQVKLIGAAEVLGAVGLIVPALVDVAPVLVPVAATGLALLMVGAAITHARREETPMIGINVVLLVLAVVVAVGRFGPQSFGS